MNLQQLLSDKSLKAKDKSSMLSEMIAVQPGIIPEVIEIAQNANDSDKATIMEAFEYVSKTNSDLIGEKVFDLASENLESKAARVKWEAAKVVGNAISQFPERAVEVVPLLLNNTDDDGTVVRWSMAYALGEILKLKLPLNKELIPAVTDIMENEEKGSIQKIYKQALKKIEE